MKKLVSIRNTFVLVKREWIRRSSNSEGLMPDLIMELLKRQSFRNSVTRPSGLRQQRFRLKAPLAESMTRLWGQSTLTRNYGVAFGNISKATTIV